MRFAIYLMRRGVIDAEQFARAVEAQLDELAPLGQLAIEGGMLTVREVLKVLRVQSDLPHDRFGDTAVELGLLSERQLNDLLMQQSARRRPMGELMVDLGILTPVQLDLEMQAFRRGQERGGAAARRVIVENALQNVASRAGAVGV